MGLNADPIHSSLIVIEQMVITIYWDQTSYPQVLSYRIPNSCLSFILVGERRKEHADYFAAIQDKEKRSRLETLYKEHVSCMYKIASRILSDEYLAQDAVQEAFINISNNLEKFHETDCNKTRAFFVIIIRNVSINIYNRRKKQSSLSFEELEKELSESGPSVFDVKAATLNIRSGPGLSYTIIGTEPNDADIEVYSVNYPNDPPPSIADGYEWVHIIYPIASHGQYRISDNGYAAWYPLSTGERYYDYAQNVKVTASSIYLYSDPSLTSAFSGSYSYGTYLPSYYSTLDYQ